MRTETEVHDGDGCWVLGASKGSWVYGVVEIGPQSRRQREGSEVEVKSPGEPEGGVVRKSSEDCPSRVWGTLATAGGVI